LIHDGVVLHHRSNDSNTVDLGQPMNKTSVSEFALQLRGAISNVCIIVIYYYYYYYSEIVAIRFPKEDHRKEKNIN